MKELLTHIVDGILGKGEAEVIENEDEEGNVLFSIKAPKDKMGLIIGKEGRTINSIKNIVKILAIKEEKRVQIDVEEKE